MRLVESVDRTDYKIQIPLPPRIDASVTMMQVEEKPDVTYSDVGGCKEQIEKLREVVETPLLNVSTLPYSSYSDDRLRLILLRFDSRNDLSNLELTRPRVSLFSRPLPRFCII